MVSMSILCLASFCENDGPVPLMVTEGLPVHCMTCFDDDTSTDRPASALKSLDLAANLSELTKRAGSLSMDPENEVKSPGVIFPPSSTPLDTPPESPRITSLQSVRNPNTTSHRRDSSFRKTYDEADVRKPPCDGCALTLPNRVKEQTPEGGPRGTSLKNGKSENGPVLRTRKPYERISRKTEPCSPKSTPSDSDEAEKPTNHQRRRSVLLKRSLTSSTISSNSSSNSCSSSSPSNSHTHYLDYTSSRDPVSPFTYGILRQNVLRTLSCESLPPYMTTPTSPVSPRAWSPSSISSPPSVPSPSGGPIFFGDPVTGYTTAYLFRITDPCARGRRRLYAFMSLSMTREHNAMRSFSYLSAAFSDLAAWIQKLADIEAERVDISQHQSVPPKPENSKSSFLSGRGYKPDGFAARRGGGMRARGIAEIVGRADFFIELHARFVALLAQLSVSV